VEKQRKYKYKTKVLKTAHMKEHAQFLVLVAPARLDDDPALRRATGEQVPAIGSERGI